MIRNSNSTLPAWMQQFVSPYAGGVGSLTRAVDPYSGNALNYADTQFGGKPLRLMYQPGMESGLPEGGTVGPGSYFAGLSGRMVNPDTGKVGAVRGFFNEDGSFQRAEWADETTNFADRLGQLAPALVLGAATLGAGGFLGGAGGGASGAAGGAAGGTGLTAGAGGVTGLTAGAGGVTGLTAPAGFALAPEIGAGLTGLAAGVQPGAAVAPAAAAPAAADSSLLGTLSKASSLVGPAASLVSSAQTVGAVDDLRASMPTLLQPEAPPVPAAGATPEARGYQAASNPILSVLGRNREANRNRTMLTGPGGVNMASTRVGANTLLGF